MKIEISKQYPRSITNGPDWQIYSDVGFGDTQIIWALYTEAKENSDKPFSEMGQILRNRYRSRKEKSDCQIYEYDRMIEVCRPKGGFPRFYILKNEEHE